MVCGFCMGKWNSNTLYISGPGKSRCNEIKSSGFFACPEPLIKPDEMDDIYF